MCSAYKLPVYDIASLLLGLANPFIDLHLRITKNLMEYNSNYTGNSQDSVKIHE